MKKGVIIGLTYGDPAGIGPEILSDALLLKKFKFRPLVIGLKKYLKKKNYKNVPFVYPQKLDLKSKQKHILPGHPGLFSAIHSYECLRESVSLALKKKIKAIITGPVSKQHIQLYKPKFIGQTEEIAKFCNLSPSDVIMLFVSNDLRIALYTRHISISRLPKYLTRLKLKKFILLLHKYMKQYFSIKNPKIAILGFNPHAGERGAFGNEEISTIIPVIKDLKKLGVKVFGPFSPDGILAKAGSNYLKNKKQEFDVFISMYHDQCLPMFKAVAGFNGVNVTLGLPFLRVSPDHGTAFDIAGKNKASAESYISSVKILNGLLK